MIAAAITTKNVMLKPAFGKSVFATVASFLSPFTLSFFTSSCLFLSSSITNSSFFWPSSLLSLLSPAVSSFFSIVIFRVAFLFPSSVVAVIVASPSFIPFTCPLLSMVATLSSLDDHVTFLFVAVVGSTTALSIVVSPTFIVVFVASIFTFVTATVDGGVTVLAILKLLQLLLLYPYHRLMPLIQ